MRVVFKGVLLLIGIGIFSLASVFIESKIVAEYSISLSDENMQRAEALATLFKAQNTPKKIIDAALSTHFSNPEHEKRIDEISSRFALLSLTEKDKLTIESITSSSLPLNQKDTLISLLTHELSTSTKRQKEASRQKIIMEEQRLLSSLLSLPEEDERSFSLYPEGALKGLPTVHSIPEYVSTLDDLYNFFKENGLSLETFSTYSKVELSRELENMRVRIEKKLSDLEGFHFETKLDQGSKIKLNNEIKNIYNSDS